MFNKVVFLSESFFFHERSYRTYGIDFLKSSGFDVQLWDFSSFLRPSVPTTEKNVLFEGYRKFESLRDATQAIASLDGFSCVICLIEYRPSSLPVYRALSRTGIPYCFWVNNALPRLHYSASPGFAARKMLCFSLEDWIKRLYRTIPFRWFGVKPASYYLAGGEQSVTGSRIYPMDETTRIVWLHASDYDTFLEVQKRPPGGRPPYGVFLDDYIPSHPDIAYFDLPPPISAEVYYPKMRKFMDRLSQDLKLDIIIAAHPQSHYDDRAEDYFGRRPTIKGKTADLVKDCQFVVVHCSTSINFAVLFEKPILIVTTDELERSTFMHAGIHAIADALNKHPINLDHAYPTNWKREMAVDLPFYAEYRNNYIKRDQSPAQPHWQIFADFARGAP